MEFKKYTGRDSVNSLSTNKYIQIDKVSNGVDAYVPNALVILEYLKEITPPREELMKMNTFDPMGSQENRLIGPAAFIMDPEGFNRWARTINLPSSKKPTISEGELEGELDQGYSNYLSGRPDEFL